MSVAQYITKIESNRNTIRNKLVELGIATSTDKLDKLANAIENMVNRGAVSVTVQEGDTYTIPAGYHNGSGTVSGVAGGGNYSLQSKSVTPTKKQQNVTPDSGYYGISDVTVFPIPEAYQDVSSVTASAADVLTGRIFVTADGTVTAGEMLNNGAVDQILDASTLIYTIPEGYHSGFGTVKIVLETKSVTPTKSSQVVTPTTGKVLSEVNVNPIPDKYQDVSGVTATQEEVLAGSKFVDSGGNLVEGGMPNNGEISETLDLEKSTANIPAGYTSGGSVSITPESKNATPSKVQQVIEPSSGKVLSDVTVEPIPDEYQNVTPVTATAEQVLVGSDFVDREGNVVNGSMPNNGEIDKTLDVTTQSYAVPAGYTPGGTVKIEPESKTVTPAKAAQNITPSAGKVLSEVKVDAIPDEYQDVSGVTVGAGQVLEGANFVDSNGDLVEGTMPNKGAIAATIDGLTTTSYTVPAGYHNGAGTVSLTGDIETALAAI